MNRLPPESVQGQGPHNPFRSGEAVADPGDGSRSPPIDSHNIDGEPRLRSGRNAPSPCGQL
jgi:hypothetical protein